MQRSACFAFFVSCRRPHKNHMQSTQADHVVVVENLFVALRKIKILVHHNHNLTAPAFTVSTTTLLSSLGSPRVFLPVRNVQICHENISNLVFSSRGDQ